MVPVFYFEKTSDSRFRSCHIGVLINIRKGKRKELKMKSYILRSATYNTVEQGWSERGCWEDLPVEKLEVSIEWTDDDGEERSDSESMTISEGWDYTDSTDYERLGKELCERSGFEYDENNWAD